MDLNLHDSSCFNSGRVFNYMPHCGQPWSNRCQYKKCVDDATQVDAPVYECLYLLLQPALHVSVGHQVQLLVRGHAELEPSTGIVRMLWLESVDCQCCCLARLDSSCLSGYIDLVAKHLVDSLPEAGHLSTEHLGQSGLCLLQVSHLHNSISHAHHANHQTHAIARRLINDGLVTRCGKS